MTDTERLVAFLLEQITAEEEAPDALPHHPYCQAFQEADDGGCEFRGDLCDCGWPARVLADCAAQRAVLKLLCQYEAAIRQESAVARPGDPLPKTLYAARDALEEAVRLLAQPHSAHPAFDPAWRLDQS